MHSDRTSSSAICSTPIFCRQVGRALGTVGRALATLSYATALSTLELYCTDVLTFSEHPCDSITLIMIIKLCTFYFCIMCAHVCLAAQQLHRSSAHQPGRGESLLPHPLNHPHKVHSVLCRAVELWQAFLHLTRWGQLPRQHLIHHCVTTKKEAENSDLIVFSVTASCSQFPLVLPQFISRQNCV